MENTEERPQHETFKKGDPLVISKIEDALCDIFDPEIPVDIYHLGLIYGIQFDEEKKASIMMTLTSPACPVAGSLPGEVETKVKSIEDVSDCEVELVWDPPWTQEMMSDEAKLKLNLL